MGRGGEQLRHRPDYRPASEEIAESQPKQEETVEDSAVFLQHLLDSNQIQEREHQELLDYGQGYTPKIPQGPVNDRKSTIGPNKNHS